MTKPSTPPAAASRALATTGEPTPPAALDANGFDPDEFEWRPVPRRPRADGWSPEVQRAFIQALAHSGVVDHAAREVDRSVRSAYSLRDAPGGESFARAWHAALCSAAQRLLDIAFTRAIEGEEIPVFDRDGCRIGSKRKCNDRLTMFILRAYMPERFRHAHESTRRPDEPPAPATIPVADALEALTPVAPPDPHLLMPSAKLESLIGGARGRAEVYALYPDLDCEKYVHERRESDHPAATERSRVRRERERLAWEKERDREQDEDK